jgi:hypothetical protein
MAGWILVFGPTQAEWPGEAVRLMLPAQAAMAAALITRTHATRNGAGISVALATDRPRPGKRREGR